MTLKAVLVPTLMVMITAWLAICVWHDLKTREVPGLLTIGPLIGMGFYAVLRGWDGAAWLVLLLTLFSELPRLRWLAGGIATAVIALLMPGLFPMLLSLYGAWLLWELGAMGGADAKILMTLLLFMGNASLILPITIAGGIQGMVALFKKEHQIPYTVSILAGFTWSILASHLI
jgi:Flp pilus assembly protein protease CpaA